MQRRQPFRSCGGEFSELIWTVINRSSKQSLALSSNTSPERPPPLQFAPLLNPVAVVPMKRKAPIAPATDSPLRRKRRPVHYAENTEESSADELSLLPIRTNKGPSTTRNTALENRVKQLEEEVKYLRAENQAEIANLKRAVADLQARLPVDEETAVDNGDDKQTASSESAGGFHWRSLLP
jgi:hypothetical protein